VVCPAYAMSTYNYLRTSLICPRCDDKVEATMACYFGWTGDIMDLKIGDRYPWRERKLPENDGRPEGGSVEGRATWSARAVKRTHSCAC
jgi:hypothetical protein